MTVQGSSNDQWLVALRGPTKDEALAELRVVLMRGLKAALGGRQRTAVLAALGGMPLEAVADRMNTNRNALYKLLHEARK